MIIDHIAMYVNDLEAARDFFVKHWADHFDAILTSIGEKLLEGSGRISHDKAIEKAYDEYKKYQQRTQRS